MTRKTPEPRPPSEGTDPTDYEVGYCRPPRHTQFRPGESGNKRGRPPKHKSLEAHVRDALAEKVDVTENGKRRKRSKAEIAAIGLVNRAAKGSVRDLAIVIQISKGFAAEEGDDNPTFLDADAQSVIELYLQARNGGSKGVS